MLVGVAVAEYFMTKNDDYQNKKLAWACLKALENTGGTASTSEIKNEVIEILELSDDVVEAIHKNSTTKLEYILGWAKTHKKNKGYIGSTERGIWFLTYHQASQVGSKTLKASPNVG